MNASILGFIFFSTELHNIGRAAVAQAVLNAGLDHEQVRDLSPRNVFIRSVRQLKRACLASPSSCRTSSTVPP